MIKKSETTILVTGATGSQGSAVADKLFDEGWKVRALTREYRSALMRNIWPKKASRW